VVFQDAVPSDVNIQVANYRKNGGYWICVFSDSAFFTGRSFLLKVAPVGTSFLLLAGMILYLRSQNVLSAKDKPLQRTCAHILLLYCGLLSIMLFTVPLFGCRILIVPGFFWTTVSIVSTLLFVAHLDLASEGSVRLLPKVSQFLLGQKGPKIAIILTFGLAVILINLWVYLPSFFHLFRHDEWFLFFSSKEQMPDLQFFVNHIDWALGLPYDRLMFRPIHHGTLALNRVLFDRNYIGPHIAAFLKHIFATFCLWWLMWRINKKWISCLFALLFSVLVIHIDPVIWPHVDAYVVGTIFTILAIITFLNTIYDRISMTNGFGLTALLLFLNMLTAEIAFLMPLVFFGAYRFVFRNPDAAMLKYKDRGSWFMLVLPMLLWFLLFSVHCYFAYPDLKMSPQSDLIGLWRPLVNVVRLILVSLSGIVFPVFISLRYADKVYLKTADVILVLLIPVVFVCVRLRRRFLGVIRKEIVLSAALVCSVVVIICFARASYVNNMLNRNYMASHYLYCISALIIFAIYALLDFSKIAAKKFDSSWLLLILAFLTICHAVKARQSTLEIQKRTAPLKKYFDTVNNFVAVHKGEPDFSFKLIDRPPKTKAFHWYHESCIDGLFNRFIDNEKPKYLLEYDYASQQLKYAIYDPNQPSVTPSKKAVNISGEADYVNSMGMQFKRVSGREYDFFMGITEVTQRQWANVIGTNPSRFKDDNRPVENVSYHMVQEFIERLNRIDKGNCYRLPTEEEYLHLISSFVADFGGQIKNIDKYAWLKGSAEGTTHPVGCLNSMPRGFYDLVGNVWEWTGDPVYYKSLTKVLPDTPRICFGASWREQYVDPQDLKTSYPPDFKHEHVGFRLLAESKKKHEQ
jgi:hypothetical protein